MVAADTSTWINFFKNNPSQKVDRLSQSLSDGILLMPPVVLMELLSFQGIKSSDQDLLRSLPRLDLREGFWERAGEARRTLLKKGLKARSMDCLIAQSCIDSDIPLISEDNDFRHFVSRGLKVI
jgi:predicted nucleic acid-binding protein